MKTFLRKALNIEKGEEKTFYCDHIRIFFAVSARPVIFQVFSLARVCVPGAGFEGIR